MRTAAEGPRVGARRETQAKAGEGIRCVVSDGTRVWVGTFGDGVLCLEKNQWHRLWPKSVTPATRPVGFVPRAAEDTVTSLALDGDSLWIATLAGLRRYRISERSLETVGENLPAFKPIGDVSYMEPWSALETGPVVAKTAGRIWYSPSARLAKGTTSGVYCLAEDRRNWKCAIPDANGRHFAEAGQYVWIATQDGLLRYDPKTNRQARFTTRDGLTSNTIVSVAADDRYIWVGVASGVSRLNRLTFERP